MKIGTFACWLWGHKFLLKNKKEHYDPPTKTATRYIDLIVTKNCVRCGADRLPDSSK